MRRKFDIAAGIAADQHGRVSWRQLVDRGIDRGRVQRWVEGGLLRPQHHGVYALGHTAPSWHADLMAAVLACGDGAVASHGSSAHLLRRLRTPPPAPHITVPTIAGRTRRGIVIHRVKTLHPLDAMKWDGIATTTVPRLLLDLAPSLLPHELARLCHEAWIRHDTTPARVEACIARNPNKPGIAKLRRALGSDVTLSALEDDFLALLARHDLPPPRTNIDHAGDKVDCHWPDRDLTIELVSFRYHATRHAFEQDIARRRRSNHVQYTYGDVVERGPQTAADVARFLQSPSCGAYFSR